MNAANAWLRSWSSGPYSPVLTFGNSLDLTIQYRMERALEEAAKQWETQRARLKATIPKVTYISPDEPEGWHRYYVSLEDDLPLHEWAVERGSIQSRLVAARNNLFREILKRSSGWSENRIKKKVGYLDWPNALTLNDWHDIQNDLQFVHWLILNRVEVSQPFRDRRPDASLPSQDWMRQGGVQSSRQEANDDKHKRTLDLQINLLGTWEGRHNHEFTINGLEDRNLNNSPHDGEPVVRLKIDSKQPNPLSLREIEAHIVIPNRSQETRDISPWSAASEALWYQLVENVWALHAVQVGPELAYEFTGPLVSKYERLWIHGDMTYQVSREGEWTFVEIPNPFEELFDVARNAQKQINSFTVG